MRRADFLFVNHTYQNFKQASQTLRIQEFSHPAEEEEEEKKKEFHCGRRRRRRRGKEEEKSNLTFSDLRDTSKAVRSETLGS
jgi:hypothetical protein